MSENYVHKNLSTGLSATCVQKLFSATYLQIIILRAMHPGFYCPEDLSRNNFPGIISRIFFIKTMPGYFSLWGICSREIGQITCQKFCAQEKKSSIIMLVAHADWPMCRALCPPPMTTGYVHNLYERCISPCGGSVPWTFLMSMVIVAMVFRVYFMSGLKLALPNDIKLPGISRGHYTWAYTVAGDFPGINRVYWRSMSPVNFRVQGRSLFESGKSPPHSD